MKFELQNQTLHNADWREFLPTLPDASVDLLLTDPPYGITPIAWDKKVDWTLFWGHARRICKPLAPMILFAVLDPFVGSGTTLAASMIAGRRGIGCDINPEYFKTAKQRLTEVEAAISE